MHRFRRQRGQAIVEFAIVVPFFFMLLIGVVCYGMVFHDFLTANELAREAARYGAANDQNSYPTAIRHLSTNPGLSGLYQLKASPNGIVITRGTVNANDFGAVVTATVNLVRTPGMGDFLESFIPADLQGTLQMRVEE